jgi:hypothetical protein
MKNTETQLPLKEPLLSLPLEISNYVMFVFSEEVLGKRTKHTESRHIRTAYCPIEKTTLAKNKTFKENILTALSQGWFTCSATSAVIKYDIVMTVKALPNDDGAHQIVVLISAYKNTTFYKTTPTPDSAIELIVRSAASKLGIRKLHSVIFHSRIRKTL